MAVVLKQDEPKNGCLHRRIVVEIGNSVPDGATGNRDIDGRNMCFWNGVYGV